MSEIQEKTNNVKQDIEIPIRFNTDPGKQSVYATNLLLQTSNNVVLLSFYEEQVPVLTGKSDEIETLKRTGIRADCVARVVVPESRYKDFVSSMQEILEKIESNK